MLRNPLGVTIIYTQQSLGVTTQHTTPPTIPPPPHLTRHFIKNAECISHSGLLFSIRLRQYKLSVLQGCLHKCVVSILSLFGELIHFAVGFMYELKQNQTNQTKSELQNIFLRKLLTPSHCRVLLTSLHNGDKGHPALQHSTNKSLDQFPSLPSLFSTKNSDGCCG